ncbi:MAG: HAD-IB family phosphatase [Anaerolineales bacterium]|nr:HAD-IB family phosphatase [Anaerolineales bacterium]
MRWTPYKNIFFDCDSTLSTIEGIDVLAESCGKKETVEALTNAAMNGQLDLQQVYGQRLQAIRPTHQQIMDIKAAYKRHLVEDATAVVQTLQALGHNVFIISGGLYEPVREFGIWLGVPAEHIRAVEVQYDALSGEWWRPNADQHYKQYEEGALTVSDGKGDIVRELLEEFGQPGERALLIGDGSSDLLASRSVDLFVGFGGVIARQKVLAEAPAFIHSASLAPLLALVLGPAGLGRVSQTPHAYLADKCRQLIITGELSFHDERLKQKFEQAYQAVYPRPDRSTA